ncbi:MAG: TonB-dependent receptor [Gemmatimonadetes bacterium]|nr:TonB-dependent receptor [Gemmatimonadota bacterium]
MAYRLGMKAIFLFLITALPLGAQPLHGLVRTTEGAAIPGANVFVLETLEGALTDSSGQFSFTPTAPRPLTLLVKRLGFVESRRIVTDADTALLSITLDRASASLTPITVRAGAYTAGEERGATLTALEVVTTPGTSADINRAIQLLPGVQAVDDGTALFVRGGDYTETKVFMNEAQLLNPQQLLTPTGTFVGTVDPFQLEGIYFSSGGFGARYGNALSGVVGLRTRGEAPRHAGSIGAGLAATSVDLALRVHPRLTLRAAGNRTNLAPFFRVNQNQRGFAPPPSGHDGTVSATLGYRPTGEVKALVLDQSNLVGVPIDDPAFSGTFNSRVGSRLAVVTWKEVFGTFGVLASASEGTLDRREDYGAFGLHADQRQRQLFAQLTRELVPGTTLRLGGELESQRSTIRGSLAAANAPGDTARRSLYAFVRPATRFGSFVELEWQPRPRVKLVPGVRSDRSTLTGRRTVDPRLSLAWEPVGGVTATAAWGVYHQVADPLYYDDAFGRGDLAPMRATQSIVGVQVGSDGPTMLRLELYEKQYRDLAVLDRTYRVFAPATGRSRGIDLFFKGRLPGGMTSRTTLSLLRAERTDPATGALAPAAYDVRRSSAIIVEKAFANGLRLGGNWRSATGRPYTEVVAATFDAARDLFVPAYGPPNAERFGGIRRLDLSASRYRPLGAHAQSVLYVSVSNVLNAANVQGWRYSRDYRTRTPLPSIFNRSLYFGASLIWQ